MRVKYLHQRYGGLRQIRDRHSPFEYRRTQPIAWGRNVVGWTWLPARSTAHVGSEKSRRFEDLAWLGGAVPGCSGTGVPGGWDTATGRGVLQSGGGLTDCAG